MITKVSRNYLEIKSVNELSSSEKPTAHCNVIKIDPPDFELNKFFYKQIGKDHRWVDRLIWDEQKWISYVNNPSVKTYVLKEKQKLIGFFEQIIDSEKKECEIAFFGILKEFFGNKYGSYLLSEAIKISFNENVHRVWLHTCSLDHQNALKNYLARGMQIFKSETINLEIN